MLFLEHEMKSRETRLTSVDEIRSCIFHICWQVRSLDFELLVSFSCPLVNWIKQSPDGQAD